MHIEYDIMNFISKATARLTVIVEKTLDRCMEFCKMVLTTQNRCQTSSTKTLQEFPEQEEHLKYLHDRREEDELHIQLVKNLSEKVVKGLVAQAAISNFLPEEQVKVTTPRVAEIKS